MQLGPHDKRDEVCGSLNYAGLCASGLQVDSLEAQNLRPSASTKFAPLENEGGGEGIQITDTQASSRGTSEKSVGRPQRGLCSGQNRYANEGNHLSVNRKYFETHHRLRSLCEHLSGWLHMIISQVSTSRQRDAELMTLLTVL